MASTVEFELPERISVARDPEFLAFLAQHASAPVDVSAVRLQRLDTPLLQCLLAAAADWRARGLALRLTGVSADLASVLHLLGVTPSHLVMELQG